MKMLWLKRLKIIVLTILIFVYLLKIELLKNNSILPASVKSSFDCSFKLVSRNLLWFNSYSEVITKWLIDSKKDKKQNSELTIPGSSDISTQTLLSKTFDNTSPSNASCVEHFYMLSLIILTVLFKTFI